MRKWKLTPKRKFKIALEFARLGNKWTEIERWTGFLESTVRSLFKRAQTNQFEIKMRRSKAITDEMRFAIIQFVAENNETSLSTLQHKLSYARSKKRSIIYKEKIYNFPKTPICNLTDVYN